MKLKKLTLTNFEGMKALEINANGKSIAVYGDNGTGKTTIADAQAWLLFDKDSNFTSNFSPKMRDENGEDIHNVDCSVKATYECNGTAVTLEKVMKEDWKKKRGSVESVFSGHKITYFVDGVPQKEKDYIAFVEDNFSAQNTLMLLSMPQYFSEILDIKKRRDLLMSLVNGVSDIDVMNSNDELSTLLEMTLKTGSNEQRYSIDEFLKISKSNASQANAQIKEIPGRIDELTRTLSQLSQSDISDCKAQSDKLKAEIASLNAKLNCTDSEMVLSLKEDIANYKTVYANSASAYATESREANDSIFEKISGLNNQKSQISNIISNTNNEILCKISELDRIKKQREDTLKAYTQTQALSWSGDTICPTCKQPIPQEQLEQSKAVFNTNKSNELERLNAFGKEHCSKDMISKLESEIHELQNAGIKHKSALAEIEKNIEYANSKIVYSKPFEDTQPAKNITLKIEGIQAQINGLENNQADSKDKLRQEISQLTAQVDKYNRDIMRVEMDKDTQRRIAELSEQEKNLGEEFAKAQQGVYLCELFSRTRAQMLTDKINGLFHNVRFRLFKTQINGGITDDCEVMAYTSTGYMPYSTANNAAKISAGLEIIRTFAKHYGNAVPVFVDNAESITKLDTNGLQVIRLVVSENDKTLRFETEDF